MKATTWFGLALGVAAGALLVYSLRLEARTASLRAELPPPLAAPEPRPAPEVPAPVPVQPALTEAEKAELLRLRGQVQPLLRRQAALAALTNQHAQLRERIAAVRRAGEAPPPGYLRRSEARAAGNATPEAVFETFLWALEHRDTNAFFQALGGRSREAMSRMLEKTSADELFKNLPIPGGRILGKKETGPDAVQLTVELGPGMTLPMPARREGSGWVLVLE